MGAKNHVRADFIHGHRQFSTADGSTHELGTTGPYDYLLGALSGCLFATFESLTEKMHVAWEHVEFELDSEKRDTSPMTMKECTVKATVTGCDDKQRCLKAFETATRYCSVYQTLSHVATMHWDMDFNEG